MMFLTYFQFVTLLLIFFSGSAFKSGRMIIIRGFAQGTTYQVKYMAIDSIVTQKQTDSILHQIDLSLSLYNKNSIITRFNAATRSVKVDSHFKNVVAKSLYTFRESGGAFDITVKPLVDAWGFGVKGFSSVPSESHVREILACVSSRFIKIEKGQIIKSKSCVQIDCNGIAQGYSVDVIAEYLMKLGLKDFLVEVGGEVRAEGTNEKDESWSIAIEGPGKKDDEIFVSKVLRLGTGAVTTSGNYKKYYLNRGKKYSHIINPKSGYPANNNLVSVTVIAPDAMTADAFDNTFMVMGLNSSLKFLESRKHMDAYFIYQTENGEYRDTATAGFYRFIH
jgi:thiamine biosynthesis lipoprotein